jgi:hypothetical protein
VSLSQPGACAIAPNDCNLNVFYEVFATVFNLPRRLGRFIKKYGSVIARHYSDLADREEQVDKSRMAERLKQLKLQRGEATNKPTAPIYLIAAESLPLREQIRAAEQLCNN